MAADLVGAELAGASGHLADLRALAGGAAGIDARDSAASLENLCRKLLDEQLAGALGLLFHKTDGLTAALRASVQRADRNQPALVLLRWAMPRLQQRAVREPR